MSTALSALISAVNDKLQNYTAFASFSGTGDGSATTYKLKEAPIVSASESVVVNSVALTEDTSLPVTAGTYYLDDDTGWLVFGTAPTNGHTIAVTYRYKLWSDDWVTEEINNGIDYLFGDFYVVGWDDDTVTDSTNNEYALPPSTEKVMGVEWSSTNTSTTTWYKKDNWETRPTNTYTVTADTSDYLSTTTATTLALAAGSGVSVTIGDVLKDAASAELVHVTGISTDDLTVTRGYRSTTATTHASAATWNKWNDKILHFSSAPGAGYLRLRTQKLSGGLSSTTDTLEYTALLPARAKEPLVLYACWKLLFNRIPDRLRHDIVPRAAGEWVVTPNQLMQGAASFKALLDMHVNRMRQRPVTGRSRL